MSRRWHQFRGVGGRPAQKGMSRRAFLHGAGAFLSLPFLESVLPVGVNAWASNHVPVRLLFYYVPNGMHMPAFTPQTSGTQYDLPSILEPLASHRERFNIYTGLANRAGQDSVPGDHARGTASFLTCERVVKTSGDGIQNGISVDQVAAQALGHLTAFPSLQFGTAGGASVGDCDSGYSCAYSRNISWAGPGTPLAKVTNPRLAFDRLFGGLDSSLSEEAVARRRRYKLSKLDTLVADALSLKSRLSVSDRLKLDEYLTGLRELELRVQSEDELVCTPGNTPPDQFNFPLHVDLMTQIMVKAFQCDMTRIISFMMNNAGSNQTFPFLGVSGAHHEISHHQDVQENFDKLETIGTWEVAQWALLLDALSGVAEGDGTLLDHCLVYFSSEISDGNAHNHNNLPVIVAGSGGGAMLPGRHVQMPSEVPMANLFLSMLRAVGVEQANFGMDSTGHLDLLSP